MSQNKMPTLAAFLHFTEQFLISNQKLSNLFFEAALDNYL